MPCKNTGNKVFFEIGHPAHIHLFKNFASHLNDRGVPHCWGLRDTDIIRRLSECLTGDKVMLSKPHNKTFSGMIKEQLARDWSLYKFVKNNAVTHVMGTFSSVSHIRILDRGIKSYIWEEDDAETIKLYAFHTYPLATKVIKPDTLSFEGGRNDLYHSSYHELAYLHPSNFAPSQEIVSKYGLVPKKYVVARFSALKAFHDFSARGISSELWEETCALLKGYRIVKSSEKNVEYEIKPEDMHHVLAFAKMIISDSQTMTLEAAVLGVPAVRVNTFIGKSKVIEEVETRYRLAFGFLPNERKKILETVSMLATDPAVEEIWSGRRRMMLSEKIDLNQWTINYFKDII